VLLLRDYDLVYVIMSLCLFALAQFYEIFFSRVSEILLDDADSRETNNPQSHNNKPSKDAGKERSYWCCCCGTMPLLVKVIDKHA